MHDTEAECISTHTVKIKIFIINIAGRNTKMGGNPGYHVCARILFRSRILFQQIGSNLFTKKQTVQKKSKYKF